MQCAKCGAEVKPTDACCPHCSVASHKVEAVNNDDLEQNVHVTIEEHDDYEYSSTNHNRRVYIKQIQASRLGFWPMLVGGLLVVFIFIVALPIALLLSFVSAIFWFFFRRR